jgi:dTDP-4-dehydrorhamnose reductase
LSTYGLSKSRAEQEVLARAPDSLLVRTSAFFGPWDQHNFAAMALRSLAAGRPFSAATDFIVSPTYVPDLVHATLDLLIDDERGLWHLANAGAVSWFDFARELSVRAGFRPSLVSPLRLEDSDWVASRPPYSVLASERGSLLPGIDAALRCFFRDGAPSFSSA